MKERDVVLMAIEQADGLRKNRPVLLLCEMPKYGDFFILWYFFQDVTVHPQI